MASLNNAGALGKASVNCTYSHQFMPCVIARTSSALECPPPEYVANYES